MVRHGIRGDASFFLPHLKTKLYGRCSLRMQVHRQPTPSPPIQTDPKPTVPPPPSCIKLSILAMTLSIERIRLGLSQTRAPK